jgi:hypothetical protein
MYVAFPLGMEANGIVSDERGIPLAEESRGVTFERALIELASGLLKGLTFLRTGARADEAHSSTADAKGFRAGGELAQLGMKLAERCFLLLLLMCIIGASDGAEHLLEGGVEVSDGVIRYGAASSASSKSCSGVANHVFKASLGGDINEATLVRAILGIARRRARIRISF